MKIKTSRDTLSHIYLDSLKIRMTVFVEEQKVPYNIEVDKYEALCVHFVCYDTDGQPLGTMRLLPIESKKQMLLQRLAVLKEYRNKSIGKQLVLASEKFAIEQHYDRIELHAQLSAQEFYHRLGYQPFGDIFDEAGIKHITMKKVLK
jgi:predicted GNAT family N-acyltransferase